MTTQDPNYPAELHKADVLRGQRDGRRRIPALAEVRRLQEELHETGGSLTVGYQKVLLTEAHARLNDMYPRYRNADRAGAQDLREHEDRIVEAEDVLRRAEARLAVAAAELTPAELLPRNFTEHDWDPSMIRNRREVARARRVMTAQQELDVARDRLRQRQVDRAAAERRRDEALSGFGIQARRLVELYRRRMTVYADALARSHPNGRTLYPLLSTPEIELPNWVARALPDDDADGRSAA